MFLDINTDVSSDKMKALASEFELIIAAIFSVPINLPGTALNRGIRATNYIREELLKIIKQRKNDPNHLSTTSVDYLSSLLNSRDGNGKTMSELQISDQLLAILVGSRDLFNFLSNHINHQISC